MSSAITVNLYCDTDRIDLSVMQVLLPPIINFVQLVDTIIVTAAQNPINELFRRFWFHENKCSVNFAHDISDNLTKLNIPHKVDEVTCNLDFTKCFIDGFQDQRNMWILDFVTHSVLSKYPPPVQETCIQYISLIAQGKPDKYIVERNAKIIIF